MPGALRRTRIVPGRRIASPAEIVTFDGGINIRDSPDQVLPNESPFCTNVTLDERGGVAPRLGYSHKNAAPMAGAASLIFYWQAQELDVVQIGASLYKTGDFSTFTLIATLTSSARVGICEFGGELVVAHLLDGVFTYDGTTWTNRSTVVKGDIAASWQNKVWVASTLGTKVWWSNIGNSHTWTTATDFNDVREPDDSPITALGAGPGMDIQGRPGLMVLKERSWHRIYDSSDGAYTTLHIGAGAAGPLAVAALPDGDFVAMADNGIFRCDGVSVPQLVSGKLEPLFTKAGLAEGLVGNMCAGLWRDRIVFSLARDGSSVNDLVLEYHPRDGWIVPHDLGFECFAQYRKELTALHGVSSSRAYIDDVFVGGTDAGSPYTAAYQTHWLRLDEGRKTRIARARVWGRGTFDVYCKRDFTLGQGDLNPVAFPSDAFLWGTGQWGSGEWGPGDYEGMTDLNRLGVATHVSFLAQKEVSTSAAGPKILGDGASPEVGAFALYGITVDRIGLGSA